MEGSCMKCKTGLSLKFAKTCGHKMCERCIKSFRNKKTEIKCRICRKLIKLVDF